MGNFQTALTDDTLVKVGDSNESSNKIGIEVKGPKETKVRVTVTVGYGSKVADLLASPDEKIDVTRKLDDKRIKMYEAGSLNAEVGKRVFDTGARPTSLPLLISLENFESNTPAGAAEITVLVQKTSTKRNQWLEGERSTIKAIKELEARDHPAIRYFTVDPNYILHAGQTEITIGFCATGYTTLTLYRNNQKVRTWRADPGDQSKGIYEPKPPPKGKEPPAPLKKETPSITSVYRLVGKYKNGDQPEVQDMLERTVHVISSGWNQLALRQGAPTRLFVANDFSGGGADRLYGIFKDKGGHHALYSSATGVDAWRPEPGEVPQDMATSPGVYYNNKLWLIGGSSVDPNPKRSRNEVWREVWCYEKDPNTGSRSWEHHQGKNDFDPGMEPRMGHACVVFQDALWVIGGYNGGEALRDVWQGKENGQGKLVWSLLNKKCPWASRLNPAAVTWKSNDGCKVWIYGGSKVPQDSDPKRDFWATTDGKTWHEEDETCLPSVPIMPDPGAPLASALVAFPPTESSATDPDPSDRLFLMGSFRESVTNEKPPVQIQKPLVPGNRIFSYLFEWHPGTGLWEGRPVFDGWQQFQGQAYYLQAVVFNRFLICWSLQDDLAFTGKLNVLVSR